MEDGAGPRDAAPFPADRRHGGARRWLEIGAVIAVLGAVLAGAALLSSLRTRPSADGPRPFAIIRPEPAAAPDFTLHDLAGRPVELQAFRGRVVFLNFWATWCAPCREELPAIEELAHELGARGLAVLAVNYQEEAEAVEAFAREHGLTVPVLLDSSGDVVRQYGVAGLPATSFIDRQGVLVGSVLGYRDWRAPEARAYLGALLTAGR